jgi:Uma2 family endonuclease
MTQTAETTPRFAIPGKYHDAAEWLHALGDIPLSRIVFDPWPGTATEQDLLVFVERDKRLVELIDGTLVEKPVGWIESLIALRLARFLGTFIDERGLGFLSGEGGTLRMKSGRIRLPDLAFVSIDDLPGKVLPKAPVPLLPFRLAVEIFSEGNTAAEMRQKRKEYFDSGTRLMWIVYPESRTIEVFDQPSEAPARHLTESDTLDGAAVLPGFSLKVSELFAVLRR